MLSSFKDLLAATGTPANAGRGMLDALRERLLPSLKWRQAQLINKLYERRHAGDYAESARAMAKGRPVLRVLVMGGGPIGLRCAVELALLGHSVLALEQRRSFTRLNVLHLWDWVSHDLAELGIKSLDPSVFASCDYAHVGTSQLQHSLLKIALLLGVQIRLGAKVSDLADLRASEPSKRRSLDWPTNIAHSPGGTARPVPLLPTGGQTGGQEEAAPPPPSARKQAAVSSRLSLEVVGGEGVGDAVSGESDEGGAFSADVLVDATGARCGLFTTIGFDQVTALKSARALGVVCHFVNGKTSWENALTEANWAQQFNGPRFAGLRERGVNLQNIVYYRSTGAFSSTASHYFVMTAEADSLHRMGALRAFDGVPEADLCASGNVDRERLVAYVRLAVAEFVPELGDAPLIHEEGVQGVQIFDFSERKVSNRASVLMDAERLGGSEGHQVLVTRVGDALQEPFWPEGLGINRGFSALLRLRRPDPGLRLAPARPRPARERRRR